MVIIFLEYNYIILECNYILLFASEIYGNYIVLWFCFKITIHLSKKKNKLNLLYVFWRLTSIKHPNPLRFMIQKVKDHKYMNIWQTYKILFVYNDSMICYMEWISVSWISLLVDKFMTLIFRFIYYNVVSSVLRFTVLLSFLFTRDLNGPSKLDPQLRLDTLYFFWYFFFSILQWTLENIFGITLW